MTCTTYSPAFLRCYQVLYYYRYSICCLQFVIKVTTAPAQTVHVLPVHPGCTRMKLEMLTVVHSVHLDQNLDLDLLDVVSLVLSEKKL